jgi:hypothetical protein
LNCNCPAAIFSSITDMVNNKASEECNVGKNAFGKCRFSKLEKNFSPLCVVRGAAFEIIIHIAEPSND